MRPVYNEIEKIAGKKTPEPELGCSLRHEVL